jgi:hypothetical protein
VESGRRLAACPPAPDFAVLNLSENQTRMKHLQRNKDQLSRTETPLFHKNCSTMWVLANRLDAPRLVPVRILAEWMVVQLGVPINEIYEHVETQLFDLISRQGILNRPYSRLST